MKKRFALMLTCLFLLAFPGCAQAEAPENPYRMKTQIHETYDRDGSTRTIRFEYAYDEKGWNESIETYYDDVLDNTRVFSRDAYGNLTATTLTNADGTQTIEENKLILDDQHRVLFEEVYWDGELGATSEMAYDEDGNMTMLNINRIDASGGEDTKSFVDRTYDRNGNLIREDIRWESSDTSTSYVLYTYDRQGKLLRTEEYRGKELVIYTEYSYDDTGLIRTALNCEEDGTVNYKTITTFDAYGNELERVTYDYHLEQMIYGQTDEEPDNRNTVIYEPIP